MSANHGVANHEAMIVLANHAHDHNRYCVFYTVQTIWHAQAMQDVYIQALLRDAVLHLLNSCSICMLLMTCQSSGHVI